MGKEFHSLVCPLLPFEFWCWLPHLAAPLGVFWEILIQTLLEMCTLAFLLLPQPNKSMEIFAAPFQSRGLGTETPFPSLTRGAPKQEHKGIDNQIPKNKSFPLCSLSFGQSWEINLLGEAQFVSSQVYCMSGCLVYNTCFYISFEYLFLLLLFFK